MDGWTGERVRIYTTGLLLSGRRASVDLSDGSKIYSTSPTRPNVLPGISNAPSIVFFTRRLIIPFLLSPPHHSHGHHHSFCLFLFLTRPVYSMPTHETFVVVVVVASSHAHAAGTATTIYVRIYYPNGPPPLGFRSFVIYILIVEFRQTFPFRRQTINSLLFVVVVVTSVAFAGKVLSKKNVRAAIPPTGFEVETPSPFPVSTRFPSLKSIIGLFN